MVDQGDYGDHRLDRPDTNPMMSAVGVRRGPVFAPVCTEPGPRQGRLATMACMAA